MIKKIPLRKCIGCTEMKPKKELLRIVKSTDGEIFIDKKGKANGRGAYVCSTECMMIVSKKKLLDRVFELKVGDDIYEELLKELENDKD